VTQPCHSSTITNDRSFTCKYFAGATAIHSILKTTSRVLHNGIRIVSSQYSSHPISISVWHFFSVHVFNIAKLLSHSNGSSPKVSRSRLTRSVVLLSDKSADTCSSLISGKFSDLTIIHGTHKWNAHKVVVCSQSRRLEFLMENKTVRTLFMSSPVSLPQLKFL
jgi:hypothetical protein